MSKKKLAVYDLDNTLYKKDTFKVFYKYILRKGNCSLRIHWKILVSYIMCIFRMRNWKSYKENVLFLLKGKNRHEINEITDEFISELKQEKYRSELLKSIVLEKKGNYILTLLTASPDIYACKIAEKYGFDKVFATKTIFANDRFTGKISGKDLRGKEKLKVFKKELNENDYDLKASRGYGNKDDISWMSLFGHMKIYE